MSISVNDGGGAETLTSVGLSLEFTAGAFGGGLTNPEVSGVATSATTANLLVTVFEASQANPITIRYRIKSGSAATDKATEFPGGNTLTVTSPGTYAFPNGGTLSTGVTYYPNAFLIDGLANETPIVTGATFTTDSEPVLVAPSNLRFVAGGTSVSVSEDASVASTVGTIIADGSAAISFAETSDPDSKFTVTSGGIVSLSAALVYATDTSHNLTVQATNDAGTAPQVFTINVTEAVVDPPPPDVTADYTVASIAAFYTLVNSWPVSGGIVQVPGGIPRVVALTGNSSGLTSARRFSHTVTLRGVGPFGSGWNNSTKKPTRTLGATLTNVNLTGWENLRLYLLGLPSITWTGSTDLTIERCSVWGTEFNGTTALTADEGGAGQVLNFENTTRTTIKDCHIAFSSNALIYCGQGNVDPVIEGNAFDLNRHDVLKVVGNNNVRPDIRYNWWSRTICQGADDNNLPAHVDSIQSNFGTTSGMTAYGNAGMAGWALNNGSGKLQGHFFAGSSVHTNLTNEQNCLAGVAVNGMYLSNTPVGFGVCKFCDVITASDTASPPFIINGGAWTNRDDNIVASHSLTQRTASAGANGIGLDCGNVNQGDFDPSVYTSSGLYTGIPGPTTGFEYALPPSSAVRSHWGNGDPTGAYLLKKRVFSDGLHPGNVGWPVAGPWSFSYNFNGGITSDWGGSISETANIPSGITDGSYDADGNNTP